MEIRDPSHQQETSWQGNLLIPDGDSTQLEKKLRSVNPETDKTIGLAVSGDVNIRRLERDIIDTAEFQRLHFIKQLGTSYFVYPSATHTRFEHSLGTLFESGEMVRHIQSHQYSSEAQGDIPSHAETLVRLAALLHDVTHIPFGHTLEDETNVIPERHDEDSERFETLILNSRIGEILSREIGREGVELLRRIMEAKPVPSMDTGTIIAGSASPHSKLVTELKDYAYVSDIVNNTVCADLLDYLKRDVYYCNVQESFSHRFLRYLYLDWIPSRNGASSARRLIIRLWRAGHTRRDILSELVNLLRIRYCLGEKVYFHHAKVSSSAMIARAVWSAMHTQHDRPLLKEDLYRMGDHQLLLRLEASSDPVACKIARYLLRRNLYKNVYTLDRLVANSWRTHAPEELVKTYHNVDHRTKVEDELAAACGLKAGDVLIYCPGLDMASKYARVLVEWKGDARMLGEIDDQATRNFLTAIEDSHRSLWALQVFINPEVNDYDKAKDNVHRYCSAFFEESSSGDDIGNLRSAIEHTVMTEMGARGTPAQALEVAERLVAAQRNSAGPHIPSLEEINQAIHNVCEPD